MKSAANTLYEYELEKQVWAAHKLIKRQVKIIEELQHLIDKHLSFIKKLEKYDN